MNKYSRWEYNQFLQQGSSNGASNMDYVQCDTNEVRSGNRQLKKPTFEYMKNGHHIVLPNLEIPYRIQKFKFHRK
jgi:hypothetical protein